MDSSDQTIIPEEDLAVQSANLEEEAPPFDVEAGACPAQGSGPCPQSLARQRFGRLPARSWLRRPAIAGQSGCQAERRGARRNGYRTGVGSGQSVPRRRGSSLRARSRRAGGGGGRRRKLLRASRMAEGWGISRARRTNIGMLGDHHERADAPRRAHGQDRDTRHAGLSTAVPIAARRRGAVADQVSGLCRATWNAA